MQSHIDAGRGHLLTEDVVRFAVVVALGEQEVTADRMVFEHRVPGIGPIDLVIDPDRTEPARMGAAIELKFPRDPHETNAPDTMILGGLLNDFYRLARLRSDERWAIQVIGARLARHLSARRDIAWTLAADTSLELVAGLVNALPATARHVAIAGADGAAVSARCHSACQVGDLTFAAYLIAIT